MESFRITRNVYTIPTDRVRAEPPARRPQSPTAEPIVYSVIVPFYNEAAAAETLCRRLARVMRRLGKPYEVILVNDGSVDETGGILERAARCDDRVTLLDLGRNFGQTTAIQAGLDAAVGSILITMDGSGRHDPHEIPLLVRKINEGYDVAGGRRVRRGGSRLGRWLAWRPINWMLSKASGVKLQDFGTTFKAYRRQALEGVRLYGEMQRFLPAVCSRLGAKVCQVPIKSVPLARRRSSGRVQSVFRAAQELLALRFMTAYLTGRRRFFGTWGVVMAGGGTGLLAYGVVRKLLDWKSSLFVEHGLLMAVGFMLVVTSALLLATGLIGDLLMRICFEAAGNKTYAVRRVIRRDPPPDEEPAGH